MVPRETENNAYAKFWGDKQRALWYVMLFSGVVNYNDRGQVLWARETEHPMATQTLVVAKTAGRHPG